MAVYDGFFDAVLDDETEEYDRAYESGDFTGYFEKIIGSGVCVHGNENSFKVRLENGKAVVSPGYLFIQGYWCKNDADYPIDLPGTSSYAIVAHLNLGKRMIELEARSVAQAYPDSLVLAIVSPTAAEDTRHNTDICGIIETAGELSSKVEWAVNYIDTEIESKLAQVEQDIAAQSVKLDRKIAEVQAVADSIVPPPIGSIKFSASQDVDETWLKCDGSFVNEADYPELVAALGKLIPSGDKFQLISNGQIGPQISNGVVYGGRMWVYSYSTKKLYGVDLAGTAAIKEIAVTSEDTTFNNLIMPTPLRPIALSIVPNETGAVIFLAQIISDGDGTTEQKLKTKFLLFKANFTGDETELQVERPFTTVYSTTYTNAIDKKEYTRFAYFDSAKCVPYVISASPTSERKFYCAVGVQGDTSERTYKTSVNLYLVWKDGDSQASYATVDRATWTENQRLAFSKKTKGDLVYVSRGTGQGNYYEYDVLSIFNGVFSYDSGNSKVGDASVRRSNGPLTIGGYDRVLFDFEKNSFLWVTTDRPSIGTGGFSGLPSSSRVFVDAAAYLWGKDIYLIFVGTGIIFSRTLEDGSFGYLDTTSVLGTITQFGYLDYDETEGTLYLLGQDTTNTVKVAKIVLNTLYDYANDGAWLPSIASDGVPAWIKAKEAQ